MHLPILNSKKSWMVIVVSYLCKHNCVLIAITKNIKLKVWNYAEIKALKGVFLYILRNDSGIAFALTQFWNFTLYSTLPSQFLISQTSLRRERGFRFSSYKLTWEQCTAFLVSANSSHLYQPPGITCLWAVVGPYLGCFTCLLVMPDDQKQLLKFVHSSALSSWTTGKLSLCIQQKIVTITSSKLPHIVLPFLAWKMTQSARKLI